MEKQLQTAVLFTAHKLEDRDLIFLIPQKLIIGEMTSDSTSFSCASDSQQYMNMDEALRNGYGVGFYFAKPLKDLEEKYQSQDINEITKKYLGSLYEKVYFYENFDIDNFESCFLKECSIEEFNKKFDLEFKYGLDEPSKKENTKVKSDPISNEFSYVKSEINKTVLFQDRVKKEVLATLYDNFINKKGNTHILLSGSTGLGKTAFLQQLERSFKQSVLYIDFDELVADSNGDYLDTIFEKLYERIMYNPNAFEQGIVMIDNIYTEDDEDSYEIMALSEEIVSFVKNKSFILRRGSKQIKFTADKITFILCGDFSKVEKDIIVPLEFFENDEEFEMNEIPSQRDLILKYGFVKEIFKYVNIVSFDDLTFDQAKQIMTDSNISSYRLYLEQLKKQGINTYVPDEVIDLICNRIYKNHSNMKNMDKVVRKIFKDIVVESLDYVGQDAELEVNKDIFSKDKKGYQFKLINGSKND